MLFSVTIYVFSKFSYANSWAEWFNSRFLNPPKTSFPTSHLHLLGFFNSYPSSPASLVHLLRILKSSMTPIRALTRDFPLIFNPHSYWLAPAYGFHIYIYIYIYITIYYHEVGRRRFLGNLRKFLPKCTHTALLSRKQ